MKSLLICHHDAPLDRVGLARWLASFSELVGVVEIRESRQRLRRRIWREFRRVGPLRFPDMLAYRAYERLVLARRDRAWQANALERLCAAYAPLDAAVPLLVTHSPNTAEVVAFIRAGGPDIVLARCKSILRREVFALPRRGTFVLHPGICPEYRNAYGCFWALANDDLDRVGATLLQIDEGVDTGPVYGYYHYAYDEVAESPFVIHNRVVLENLDAIREALIDVAAGRATRLDTASRISAAWGHPWLTKYVRWKFRAWRRRRASACAAVS